MRLVIMFLSISFVGFAQQVEELDPLTISGYFIDEYAEESDSIIARHYTDSIDFFPEYDGQQSIERFLHLTKDIYQIESGCNNGISRGWDISIGETYTLLLPYEIPCDSISPDTH